MVRAHHVDLESASMKALPKRKGNLAHGIRALTLFVVASMKALPKRKGNRLHRQLRELGNLRPQ